MITLLHRRGWGWYFVGGVCPNDRNITLGGGLSGPPKVITLYVHAPMEKSAKSEIWLRSMRLNCTLQDF